MDEQASTPQPDEPTVAPAAEPAPPITAATPQPFATEAPRKRRFSTPVAGGVLAGVIGLGLGAGAVALASGGDDHHGNDRRMSDQQVQTQNPQGGFMPGQNGQNGQNGQQGGFMPGQNGQNGQQGQQGGFMPGRRGDRPGQQGQQGQQGQNGQNGQGGFFPPNGGGQPQGRSGGS